MKKRVQSPSSINTYKQCPRKYYYHYIATLPTKKSIHLVRGTVVHEVLEKFFDIDSSLLNHTTLSSHLRTHAQSLFLQSWKQHQHEIKKYVNSDQEKFFFSESLLMVFNWVDHFVVRIKSIPGNLPAIFQQLTPQREIGFRSDSLSVCGYVDAIEQTPQEIRIIDYKTNANLDMSDEQRLQLAIYALLYHEKHGIMPHKAGIFFLRSKPKFITVTNDLLAEATREIEYIHQNTQSVKIDDYPLKPGPLCKTCDFYKICFEQQSLSRYLSDMQAPAPEAKLQQ